MADEKEFDNLVSAAGIKGLHTKEPYQKICGLLGIAFSSKESKAGLKNLIIASNAANPGRNFAEVLTRMPASEPKVRAAKKVTVHVAAEETKTPATDYRRPELNEVVLTVSTSNTPERIAAKERIIKIINEAHNILYTAENIEGEAALSDIMNLIFIKCLEPLISKEPAPGKIDLLNPTHYESIYPDPAKLAIILGYFVDLKTLANEDMKVLRNKEDPDAIFEMSEILRMHPVTGRVFTLNRFAINANKPNTVKKLLDDVIRKINVAELSENYDVVGDIYEHFINKYVKKGSKLGQYFTPRNLMSIILTYKHAEIAKAIGEAKDEFTVIDPCMGTGGWLVSTFSQFAREYVSKLRLCGIEVKPTTFQYGVMNLILAIKHMPGDIRCESSLTCVNDTKYNLLVTNPPFQTGKKFADIVANFESDEITRAAKLSIADVYTLKTNNPPLQFLEMDIFKLKQDGIGIIVIPDGELMHKKSYMDARLHIMSIVSITDIITVPGGVFVHTGIKTCVILFKKSGSTQSINFLQMNDDCTTLTKRAVVSITDINRQVCASWKAQDYLAAEQKQYSNSITTKSIGELCTKIAGEKKNSKLGQEHGLYPLYYCSIMGCLYLDTFDYDGEGIIINKTNGSGKAAIYFGCGKYNVGNSVIHIASCSDELKTKYLFHYLRNNIPLLETYYDGCNQKSITSEDVNSILIPYPPMDMQTQIVEYLDFIEASIVTSARKIGELKKLNKFAVANQVNLFQTEYKRLGDACKIEFGTRIVKKSSERGEYPVYGGGDETFSTDTFNREGTTLIVSRFAMSPSCVRILRERIYLNDSGLSLESKIPDLLQSFLMHYLIMKEAAVYECSSGMAQRNLDQDAFGDLPIAIPSLEIQKSLIDYCDANLHLITMLEREIETNKKVAADYLRDVLK